MISRPWTKEELLEYLKIRELTPISIPAGTHDTVYIDGRVAIWRMPRCATVTKENIMELFDEQAATA